MFCADYICSFVFHFGINYGLFQLKDVKIITKETVTTVTNQSYLIGACSGLLGALTIHKFDFVRQGAITSNKFSIIHSLSTVPYATVFFGLYFHQRNPESLKSQCSWALASAGLASLAEIPFDKAKLDMLGSTRTVIFANSLFVPFGALLLVMYDKALENDFCAKIKKIVNK